ncbi:MAG: AI-2E family transporter [Lachnospiraceae bacterium]
MKNEKFKPYVYWGVTAFTVIAASSAVVFLLLHLETIHFWWGELLKILAPVIYGAVLAYLLSPIYNRCQKGAEQWLERVWKKSKHTRHLAKAAATVVSLVVLFCVVTGLISMLLPQLIDSVEGIIESLPAGFDNLSRWLQKILEDNPQEAEQIIPIYDQLVRYVEEWRDNTLLPNLKTIVAEVSNRVVSIVVLAKNILIGVIVTVYLLNIKDTLTAQSKKLIYGLFPVKSANMLIGEFRYIHQVFGGFIIGKLVDSLIIGVMCFAALSLMKMPYVLLVSVIVGVTNVIPFFGPFIGAIPSAFLILLVSPRQCLYFLIFILLLQQFDGNILGPKILGESTGISSFWVLFSILLFGGLFGFVGMIIAVPTCAVILNLIRKWANRSLGKKALSSNTSDYDQLKYIDEEKKTYIK